MKRLPCTIFFLVAIFIFFTCEKNPTESAGKVPELTTSEVTDIRATSATCGGTITSDGGSTVTARGVCWSTGQTPIVKNYKTNDGTGVGSFTSNIIGLESGTDYYVRAYATNSIGTGYGSTMSFSTLAVGTVIDIDGNVYRTIKIGNQWWMAENLKVTHYCNGDAIPNVTDNSTWSNLTTGAYCNYDNDVNNVTTYGRLYNWHAVNGSRNIAPTGWHVPTDAEWQTLVDYLGGESVAGGKMKEIGTKHWDGENIGATNESGFSALPGGARQGGGTFGVMGNHTDFWTSTESSISDAWYRTLGRYYSGVSRMTNSKQNGCSVRCMRD